MLGLAASDRARLVASSVGAELIQYIFPNFLQEYFIHKALNRKEQVGGSKLTQQKTKVDSWPSALPVFLHVSCLTNTPAAPN